MAEYNRLTSYLLAKGFDEAHYPAYVKIAGGCIGKRPLDNVYGGFEYRRGYIWKSAFKTGCGLSVKGQSCITDLSYMGETWCYENNNPVILCPYFKGRCPQNDRRLWKEDDEAAVLFCVCHRTDTYDPDKSLEKVRNDAEAVKQQKYEEIKEQHHGRVCRVHMYYSEKSREWKLCYDPFRCAMECFSSYCPLRGRELSEKKGNVFYDIRISTIRKDDTFFNGDPVVQMEKGRRYLSKPVSIDICNAIVARGSSEIYKKEWWNRFSTLHIADPDLKIEIVNLRAESRESRDLMQDLEDIKNGIRVVHESDRMKAEKRSKNERRQQRKQRKVRALESRIRMQGLEGLSDMDRIYAEKILGKGRINELEMEKRNAPYQLSIFEDAG